MNNYCDDEICIKLVKTFFRGSLNFSLQPAEANQMTWMWQEKFLNIIFNTNLIKKYPVNCKFSRLFLKKVLSFIENNQEIHDNFYAQLCTLMSKEADKDSFCYRHYVIGNNLNDIITTKETKNTVVNGTTGMKTWEAAFVLSDWALCNKELFASKTVLELGSGVGFTGITLAKFCKPNLLLLTDCHIEVLRALCDNIKINFPELNEVAKTKMTYFESEESCLGVMMLDWNKINHDIIPADIVPDVLIGADIVYDPVIFEPLCNVLEYFYCINTKIEVFLASAIRNEDTYSGFIATLNSKQFVCEELLLTNSLFVDWDHNIKVRLLRIKGK